MQKNGYFLFCSKLWIMNKTAILFFILAILVVAYVIINSRKKSGAPVEEEHHDVEGGCCGKHVVCEKNNDRESLYFDDEELDAYVCDLRLDEDEMVDFLGRNTKSCPYYRFYDEYKSVHKQI